MKTTSSTREWTELRAMYQHWKVVARKIITNYKKYLKGTGSGPSAPTPSVTTVYTYVPKTSKKIRIIMIVMAK